MFISRNNELVSRYNELYILLQRDNHLMVLKWISRNNESIMYENGLLFNCSLEDKLKS